MSADIILNVRRKRMKQFVSRITGLTFFRGAPRGVSLGHDLRVMSLPVRTAFDIGANVGKTALEFVGYWPAARIYSFEPVASTFAELQKNTRSLRNVECYQLAMGASRGAASIYLHSRSDLNTLRQIGVNSRPTQAITVDTVDTFCGEHGIDQIDLLKTDTEGFEREVLAGASAMLSGRVRAVLVEVSFGASTERHISLSEIADLLAPYGFQLSALYDQFVHQGTRNLVFANALLVQPVR